MRSGINAVAVQIGGLSVLELGYRTLRRVLLFLLCLPWVICFTGTISRTR